MDKQVCRLCKREGKLRYSHIIPEWCYKPIYDSQHRLHELSTNESVPNKFFRQKGLREYLLCDACEELLGDSEKYVREVFYGGVEIAIKREGNPLVLGDLDYKKFKLFQLSILWRCGVSTLPKLSAVDLGRHQEPLRQMILNSKPGEPHEYGCVMSAVLTESMQPTGKIDVVDGLMVFPEEMRIHGHKAYRIIFAGSTWVFVVSSHSISYPDRKLFLSKDGTLILPLVKAEDTGYFTKFASKLKSTGRLSEYTDN